MMGTRTFPNGYQEFTEEVTREQFANDTTFMVDVIRGWFPADRDGHHTTIRVRMCRGGTMRAQMTLLQEDLDMVNLEDNWYEATCMAADETDKAFWDDLLGYVVENWEALAQDRIWTCEGDRTLTDDIFFN